MTDTKFTPGPWYTSDLFVDTVGGNGRPSLEVCDLHNSMFSKEAQANAHLIAAAPELYEVLDSIFARIIPSHSCRDGLWVDLTCDQVSAIRAALSKARGES